MFLLDSRPKGGLLRGARGESGDESLSEGSSSHKDFEDTELDCWGSEDARPGMVVEGLGFLEAGPGLVVTGPGLVDAGPGKVVDDLDFIEAGPGLVDCGPGGLVEAGPGLVEAGLSLEE